MRKARRHYSPQEKVAILRRHLVDRVSAGRLCDDLQLQPSVFYRWLRQFFENAAVALGRKPIAGKPPDIRQGRIGVLQAHLQARESRDADQKWMISLTQGQFGSKRSAEASATHPAERVLVNC